jgi:hypothetical protein
MYRPVLLLSHQFRNHCPIDLGPPHRWWDPVIPWLALMWSLIQLVDPASSNDLRVLNPPGIPRLVPSQSALIRTHHS